MTPDEAIEQVRSGKVGPVYVLVGAEQYSIEKIVATMREAVLGAGMAQFNEERLVAGEVDVDRIISASRMVPMMAKRRLIIVRSVDRWDARAQDDAAAGRASDGP